MGAATVIVGVATMTGRGHSDSGRGHRDSGRGHNDFVRVHVVGVAKISFFHANTILIHMVLLWGQIDHTCEGKKKKILQQ